MATNGFIHWKWLLAPVLVLGIWYSWANWPTGGRGAQDTFARLEASIQRSHEEILEDEIHLLDSLERLEARIQSSALSEADQRALRRYLEIFVRLEDYFETSPLDTVVAKRLREQPLHAEWQRFIRQWNQHADRKAWLHRISTVNSEGRLLPDTAAPEVQELLFFDFSEMERIGEVGAGTGEFALRASILYPNTSWWINELSPALLDTITSHLSLLPPRTATDRFQVVKGSVDRTNLEGRELDALVLRQTFHHFSRPGDMLASIRAALREGGSLYVKEGFRDTDSSVEHCSSAMPLTTFQEWMQQYGFQIQRQQITTEGAYLLHLTKVLPN